MNHFDVIQGFIERGETRAPSVGILTAEFRKAVEELGFRHFACCSHVDPLHPPGDAIMMHNYPGGWVRYYSEAKLYALDPVLQRAQRNPLPFFWDAAFRAEPITAAQKRLMTEALGYGIAHGYTVPFHLSWLPGTLRASCSILPDTGPIESRNYVVVQVMATYLYATVSYRRSGAREVNFVELTTRERECLALAAQGKSDWEIGQILHLSENTVHTYFERAKQRLAVATRIQAVVRALMSGQISCGDVLCRGLTRSPKEGDATAHVPYL
jgi:DNA-binding CsgD family transcriptional regulator